ncbi:MULTISPECIES: wax ester/triacylglycerol synthase domain-containing protein [unclassified Mycobacterium]|uniref:wax ester/triacylglycerol synthase domain-containing protein n=1 Tax=unclassified Mycobacterium TaxID=2642494 RepID=UPI000801FC9F|nr:MULTISPECIES: wax ester/triacylglycerol synthase domain-containing protein [unclassified Mycobacterium]OBG57576.1 diacylglycerol O-acyltransferase [Mycobacterium sp. E188]OBH35475.1 diacylglycerol O-acyltransferase [Mycobacterium sp. E183]
MAQVRALDTAFLKTHHPDQHAGLAIGAVAIVDGAPDHQRLQALLAERIRSIPRCTQVLRPHPTHPGWVDCRDFDLAQHVRRVAINRPGDDTELSRAIAHALERPLSPDRPQWECWVIEGLKGNRWAILMKAHPRLLDGKSPAHLLTRLCDDADESAFANAPAAEPVSQPPVRRTGWADALWRASWTATGAVVGALWPALQSPDRAATPRRYATVRVPIADVDRVCRRFGVTVNDVALAAATEGFRTVLLGRGEEPRADSLPALAPTPVRSPYLPVEDDDPVQRLRTVQTRWNEKAADTTQSGGIIESALNSLPTLVRDGVVALLSRIPQRAIVTLGTNVPGPRHRLRLMGQTMERLLPIPPTAVQLSTGVAVLSYGDELVFGITAEPGAAFDVKQLAAGIELGMARLVALSQDSVLLFGDRRRGRAPRAFPGRPPGARPPAPGQARH